MIGAQSDDVSVTQSSSYTLIVVAQIGLEILYISDDNMFTFTLNASTARETNGVFGEILSIKIPSTSTGE